MKKSIIVPLTAATVTLSAAIGIPANAEEQAGQAKLSSNEIAANGPLPGDVSLYGKEIACTETLSAPSYYSSLNAAEISDAQRSGIFPCATFTGSHDGRVFNQSEEDRQT